MLFDNTFSKKIRDIAISAIAEDVGDGDFSSLACISTNSRGKAVLFSKDKGILSGVDFAKQVFDVVDDGLKVTIFKNDGDTIFHSDTILEVEGNQQSILKAERVILNAMQRMSAIATKTATYQKLIEGTKAKVIDTRKTTPGIRILEKWAVKIGGGENHRMGLYDMIMLKDNHIDFCGGVSTAISKTKNYLKENGLDLPIVVEAECLEMVSEILKSEGIFRILLDNFNFEETTKAVKLIDGRVLTESSGNITDQNIRTYATCGVDYISCGALTHSVSNLDLSLKVF
ncbi:nicotinate-nucleotide pyrophosphorylase [carboxylating] [Elysia marginata]|uniref:Nicotinate-nucleotide pyrophosphorylase [carboxylating] n=1 Tax=Elysia marginata TaxID=1093978 RepID=A0AAV4FPP0_9GAST|nr:nicotinate-nucleotide pyrophosphorylase [carboxylating] [Elysia marginata]